MANIIQELIKIERNAEEISREAEEQKKSLSSRIEAQSREIARRIEQEAEEQLLKLRAQSGALLEERQAESGRLSRQKLEALDKEFAERAPEWEEQIFRRICDGLQGFERENHGDEQPAPGEGRL